MTATFVGSFQYQRAEGEKQNAKSGERSFQPKTFRVFVHDPQKMDEVDSIGSLCTNERERHYLKPVLALATGGDVNPFSWAGRGWRLEPCLSWCLHNEAIVADLGRARHLSCGNRPCTLFAHETKCISFDFSHPDFLPDGFLSNSRTELLNYFTYARKAWEKINTKEVTNGN